MRLAPRVGTSASRAKASASARSTSRCCAARPCGSRPRRRRPAPSRRRRGARAPRRTAGRRGPGTRCSSLNEPRPSARCRCASRSPERPRHRQRVGAGGRRVRQVERHVVVGLVDRVPVRQVGHDVAARRCASGYMFSTASRTPVSCSRRATPSTNSRGILPLPAERRVHARRWRRRPPAARSMERSTLAHGSVPQTRWVSSRVGACTDEDREPCSSDSAPQRAGLLA